jgi:hypothetical protein
MATRQELGIIRAARAGQAKAQLALGRHYLFGAKGLPRNPGTALYWLDRAASQEQEDAWLLIGRHVPFEVARHVKPPHSLHCWYERAFDAGLLEAGVVYARLVLQEPGDAAMRRKAMMALESAADAGLAEAQWLLAQRLGLEPAEPVIRDPRILEWVSRAARGEHPSARAALLEHAWAGEDWIEYLHLALPDARALCAQDQRQKSFDAEDLQMMSRCAQALLRTGQVTEQSMQMLEVAAAADERDAQFALGLALARIDAQGERLLEPGPAAQFKKAIRWLTHAAMQGVTPAWYALSRVYINPACSQRSVQEAHNCLLHAADGGHAQAQFELGALAWRRRALQADGDINAARWLKMASAQGHLEAEKMLTKVTSPWVPADWIPEDVSREVLNQHPLLAARLDLARVFGLTLVEALLIDPHTADCGHCLMVDIRAQRPRSKRRLIALTNAPQRQVLDRVLRVFENIDCGLGGPEGSFRQRIYRLKSLMEQ